MISCSLYQAQRHIVSYLYYQRDRTTILHYIINIRKYPHQLWNINFTINFFLLDLPVLHQ